MKRTKIIPKYSENFVFIGSRKSGARSQNGLSVSNDNEYHHFWLLASGFRLPALIACLLLNILIPIPASSQTPGSSPTAPAPPGTTVLGIVECGEGYTSHELYDMKVTLLEVIRGEEAWNRIKEADNSNKPAEPGTEYVLARVKFEYYARGAPGLCVHPLAPGQFAAYSSDGEDYKPASAMPPKPELRKGLKSGEFFEGWLVFAVAKEDKAPLMSYSADAGGAVQHSESKWFLLR